MTRSKTKQKILDKALELFNSNGLYKVTLRNIAAELQMSQGNLTYHYKKREEIIEQLYYDLVLHIDKSFDANSQQKPDLNTLCSISKTIFNLFYQYRFFLLDFNQIMKEQATIRTHYQQLMTLRKEQSLAMFNFLIEEAIFRTPAFENEYENLYTRVQILSDFWMSSLSIKQENISLENTKKHHQLVFETLYPYLTKKGLEAYQKLSL